MAQIHMNGRQSFLLNDMKQVLRNGGMVTHFLNVKISRQRSKEEGNAIRDRLYRWIANQNRLYNVNDLGQLADVSITWRTTAVRSSAYYHCDAGLLTDQAVKLHAMALLRDVLNQIDADFDYIFTNGTTGIAFLVSRPLVAAAVGPDGNVDIEEFEGIISESDSESEDEDDEQAHLHKELEQDGDTIAQSITAHNEALQVLTADHATQLSALQTEKESLRSSLDAKQSEMESMKAQYEAQIQASLSGSDAERQSLIADYMQQIQSLQSELAATQITEKSAELSALQVQHAELQVQLAAEQAQVESLTAQLSAAAASADEAAVAHANALQAALETTVKAERAVAAQAMQDAEESMSILRDTHREELLGELDLQKKELEAAHEQAQAHAARDEQAMAKALEERQQVLNAEDAGKLEYADAAQRDTHLKNCTKVRLNNA